MTTFATLFAGGELAGVGLQAAGLSHLWGIEYDDEIAGVARANGFHVITADVREVDYASLARPYWLHMSPPCINASVAKAGAEETEQDVELAAACVRAILALEPVVVSLENVWKYRIFAAFASILAALTGAGYLVDCWHLNAANYGVPQTRKRLILIARRDGVRPRKPRPTHHDPSKTQEGQLSLFAPSTAPWVGWYAAIEDLIDTLPESEFAPWQLARLPMDLLEEYGVALVQRHPNARGDGVYPRERPAKTVEATGTAPRAFLIESKNANQEWGTGYRDSSAPAYSVVTDHKPSHAPKAFLVEGTAAGVDNKFALPVRERTEPSMTVRGATYKGMPRAFLLSNNQQEYSDGVREVDEPSHAITQQSGGRYRALLVREDNAGQEWGKGYREGEGSSPSVSGSFGGRAYLQHGRVVKMTPRALARFQSVPDWYVLPESAGLACKVIGNGVPCVLMQKVAEHVMTTISVSAT